MAAPEKKFLATNIFQHYVIKIVRPPNKPVDGATSV